MSKDFLLRRHKFFAHKFIERFVRDRREKLLMKRRTKFFSCVNRKSSSITMSKNFLCDHGKWAGIEYRYGVSLLTGRNVAVQQGAHVKHVRLSNEHSERV